MKSHILSLDQGTTSSRAIIFNKEGAIVSIAQKEFTQYYPQPGWVEHDATEIWSTQIAVAAEAILKAGLSPTDIAAIGITNQRETTVLWNKKTGEPLHNAIVWQDRRTADYCDALNEKGLGDTINEKTGLIIDAYFSASKINWLLNNLPGARELANSGDLAFGTIDSWLVWKLTAGKVHITDVSNASRTMLFNINTLKWDEELLAIFDIPANILPEVKSSSEVYGETAGTLFSAKIPIAGIAGDQQAALFGQMCYEPGMVKNTYGTGCFMLMNIGRKPVTSKRKLVTTIAWQVNNEVHYALEGSIFIAGAVVQWLRDGLGMINSSAEVEDLAKEVTDTGGVYMVPAFTGLGAPHWDQHARGIITGITRGTTSAHIARAALESIAFQTLDVLKAMEADSGFPIKELRVDGGAANNSLLMQFQSNIINAAVIRPTVTELTAIGVAYLAGLATGFWKDIAEIKSIVKDAYQFNPDGLDHTECVKNWNRAIKATKVASENIN
jgi:glycerol kinase